MGKETAGLDMVGREVQNRVGGGKKNYGERKMQ